MQRVDPVARGMRERRKCVECGRDRRRVGEPRACRHEHLVRRAIERGQRDERVAPDRRELGGELGHGRRVLGPHRREKVGVAAVSSDARAAGERPIHADVAEVEVQCADTNRLERGQEQSQDFLVGADVRIAVELRADLQHLARLRHAAGHRAQHASGVAEPRDAGFVQKMRVDACDLRCHVRPDAQQSPGERIDDLESLQLEVVPGPGEQRLEVFDQWRLHQPIPVIAKVIEEPPAQALDPLRLGGENIVDIVRQHPLTHRQPPGGSRRSPSR